MAIIKSDGTLETNSLFPDVDWYNQNNEVVDETTEKGQALVKRLVELSPFYTLVRDSKGNIVDAEDDVEARQAWESDEQQRQEEYERTRPPTEVDRLKALESAMLSLLFKGGDK